MLVLCIYQLQECYVNFDIVMTSKTMQYLKRVNFDVVLVSLSSAVSVCNKEKQHD